MTHLLVTLDIPARIDEWSAEAQIYRWRGNEIAATMVETMAEKPLEAYAIEIEPKPKLSSPGAWDALRATTTGCFKPGRSRRRGNWVSLARLGFRTSPERIRESAERLVE